MRPNVLIIEIKNRIKKASTVPIFIRYHSTRNQNE